MNRVVRSNEHFFGASRAEFSKKRLKAVQLDLAECGKGIQQYARQKRGHRYSSASKAMIEGAALCKGS